MDRTSGMLGRTMGKLDEIIKTGSSKHMCYLALFIVLVFLMIWFVVSYSSKSDGGQRG
jgi:hypothetical protein